MTNAEIIKATEPQLRERLSKLDDRQDCINPAAHAAGWSVSFCSHCEEERYIRHELVRRRARD